MTRSYNSFSGSDIRAVIGQYQFAELQAVSYSVTREKAPIYTLGSADVRSFSRNKRGIAGTLIWINFDRHGLRLLNLVHKMRGLDRQRERGPIAVLHKCSCFAVTERDLPSVYSRARLPRLQSTAADRLSKAVLSC